MSTTEPEPEEVPPAPEPEEEPGETEEGLLPSLTRLRKMDRTALTELRDLVADWDGPLVERFRVRVAERLADR